MFMGVCVLGFVAAALARKLRGTPGETVER